MGNDKVFAFQQVFIEKGIDEIQQTIVRFDDLLFKIMTSAITVWVAIIGWSITIKSQTFMIVGIPALFCFWLIAATFRAIQLRYIGRSKQISAILTDESLLASAFAQQQMPDGLMFRLHGEETIKQKFVLIIRGIFSPTVMLIYIALLVMNLILYFAVIFPP